ASSTHAPATTTKPPRRPPALLLYNPPACTGSYTLSLHDALPISSGSRSRVSRLEEPEAAEILEEKPASQAKVLQGRPLELAVERSEEHTSELQSPCNLVCRLLLEKKNNLASR